MRSSLCQSPESLITKHITEMKKFLLVLLALSSIAFVSCYKESQYTITYHDTETAIANVTIFEYDASYDRVATREIKFIKPNQIYDLTSSDLARYLVIGVEGTVNNKIIVWYCKDIFKLDSSKPIHIDVSFTGMNTQGRNPVNESDCVQQYLYK